MLHLDMEMNLLQASFSSVAETEPRSWVFEDLVFVFHNFEKPTTTLQASGKNISFVLAPMKLLVRMLRCNDQWTHINILNYDRRRCTHAFLNIC